MATDERRRPIGAAPAVESYIDLTKNVRQHRGWRTLAGAVIALVRRSDRRIVAEGVGR